MTHGDDRAVGNPAALGASWRSSSRRLSCSSSYLWCTSAYWSCGA